MASKSERVEACQAGEVSLNPCSRCLRDYALAYGDDKFVPCRFPDPTQKSLQRVEAGSTRVFVKCLRCETQNATCLELHGKQYDAGRVALSGALRAHLDAKPSSSAEKKALIDAVKEAARELMKFVKSEVGSLNRHFPAHLGLDAPSNSGVWTKERIRGKRVLEEMILGEPSAKKAKSVSKSDDGAVAGYQKVLREQKAIIGALTAHNKALKERYDWLVAGLTKTKKAAFEKEFEALPDLPDDLGV